MTIFGAGGRGALGVTAFEAADAIPVPTLFVAVTVKVYEVPLCKPVTVHEVLDVVQIALPGEVVTV